MTVSYWDGTNILLHFFACSFADCSAVESAAISECHCSNNFLFIISILIVTLIAYKIAEENIGFILSSTTIRLQSYFFYGRCRVGKSRNVHKHKLPISKYPRLPLDSSHK